MRVNVRRVGMTLVEILVVIAIIAVLASLLLGGVMLVMRKGPETATKGDIKSLEMALGRFYSDYKFYPPSRIRLCSNRNQYNPSVMPPTPASLLDAVSLKTISAIWPKINFTNVRWDGSAGAANLDFTLEGDQCLVFFLNGLSTDPVNPMNPAADKKTFFKFDAGRLKLRNLAWPAFPSFIDGYGSMPYVYFNSGTRADAYDPTPNGLGVSPYVQQLTPTIKYYNSTTFQIISAGLDLQFGPGSTNPGLPVTQTAWTPGGAIDPRGRDDISNFSDKLLGN